MGKVATNTPIAISSASRGGSCVARGELTHRELDDDHRDRQNDLQGVTIDVATLIRIASAASGSGDIDRGSNEPPCGRARLCRTTCPAQARHEPELRAQVIQRNRCRSPRHRQRNAPEAATPRTEARRIPLPHSHRRQVRGAQPPLRAPPRRREHDDEAVQRRRDILENLRLAGSHWCSGPVVRRRRGALAASGR